MRRMHGTFGLTAGALVLASAVAMRLGAIRAARAQGAAGADMQVYRISLQRLSAMRRGWRDLWRKRPRLRTEVSRRACWRPTVWRNPPLRRIVGRARQRLGWLLRSAGGQSGSIRIALARRGYPDMPLAARLAQAETTHMSRPDQAMAEADMPPCHTRPGGCGLRRPDGQAARHRGRPAG